jgi:glycine cleavage system aminomethyltransferase T
VTRAAHSPALEAPIGMGYIRRENSARGSEVELASGKATVITAPNPHRF